jgi:Flp pilus assembly protein TadD
MAGASAPAIFFGTASESAKETVGRFAIERYHLSKQGFCMKVRTQSDGAITGEPGNSLSCTPPIYVLVVLSFLCTPALGLFATGAFAQASGGSSHPTPAPNPPPTSPRAQPSTFDETRLAFERGLAPVSRRSEEGTCFLPPLNGVQSPTVPIANLQAAAKAKKEYGAACAALKDRKIGEAEEHLRRAVQRDPKYPAAWVTLGQILAAKERPDEARDACSQALAADPGYLPPYLCLTDVAARAQKWDQTLQLSSRAIELEPTNDAVAYGYNAAANLNLHRLSEAEKSALRALEIDKNNNDPRVHFLLAQIYEAKGDPQNEAAQLREYLKFATDPSDAAMVKQYLTQLEKQLNK